MDADRIGPRILVAPTFTEHQKSSYLEAVRDLGVESSLLGKTSNCESGPRKSTP